MLDDITVAKGEKTREMILYIAERHETANLFGMTKLWEIMFYSDFSHFHKTGQSITGCNYIKLPHGPVPEGYEGFISGLTSRNQLRVEDRLTSGHPQKRPIALRAANINLFAPVELDEIDRVIRETWEVSAESIGDSPHRFVGWRAARPGERIPYGTVFLNKPVLTEDEEEEGRVLAVALGLQ